MIRIGKKVGHHHSHQKYQNAAIAFVVMLFFSLSIGANAQHSLKTVIQDAQQSKSVLQVLSDGSVSFGNQQSAKIYNKKDLKAYYTDKGSHYLWFEHFDKSDRRDLLEILEKSWQHGLNPDDYHVTQIDTLMDNDGLLSNKDSEIEILLTDAIIRYGRDISGFHLDENSISEDKKYWRQAMNAEDVLTKITTTDDLEDEINGWAPKSSLYNKLQAELISMVRENNNYPLDNETERLNFDRRLFRQGDSHKAVAVLRSKLGLQYNPQYGSKYYYDDVLAKEIMILQRAHGLEPDGVIGPKTLEILNKSNKQKIEQIIVNMERLRWMEQETAERYILVNIPSQELWAVENGKVKHHMPVIVGSPARQTNSFKATVTGVRFNPQWTVPFGIKQADYLPKLQKDPYALVNNDIEFIKGYGRNAVTVDPATIDWNSITRKELSDIRMVQGVGDHNALGRIRVLMMNKYNIYLHDTNQPHLFEKDNRALSSGCIRLSDPERMANFILSDRKGWSNNDMKRHLDSMETVEIETEKPMPVYMIYQTVWMGPDGKLVFGADIYKKDKKLKQVMNSQSYVKYAQAMTERHASASSHRRNSKTRLASND